MKNRELVDKISRATLYEGYMLYPYRASAVKNQQRFNFGGIYPPAYSHAQNGTDACVMQTECLVAIDSLEADARLEAGVRFLHLRQRDIERLRSPWQDGLSRCEMKCELVDSLEANGLTYHTWQEAVEREINLPEVGIRELIDHPISQAFSFDANEMIEPLREGDGKVVGFATRCQARLSGTIGLSATRIEPTLFKVRVLISNSTLMDHDLVPCREEALARALLSTHTILEVTDGAFVSLLDPPEEFCQAARSCDNVGTWPVLVGESGERDTLLSSPIILYDYPQLAPESAGELFDGTEIDEILTLRIMTLTDDEKREMRAVDERSRAILERTESMPQEQFMKMHGVIRGLRATASTS
jgi:hydrogenase maturation protease